ncbi:FAD-binding oxidoreductase [Mycobacterium sp. PSTR-4-N]|uniref:FAD-binding oxidoreductase n=1 Tax=Mycobacterium sp. PSTR-4-N TaxID=2917745 RepID=UPI001F14BE9D|nr:FAD-dependent oxidoreductase [Mycobacterium sp. PSTR-4-N]MCG7594263.1 FAD-dependent oxidoreductase [Mycobacterium sp. PSTR-4-N]
MTDSRTDVYAAPDTELYRAATTPHNATVTQHPAAVAHPHTAEEVADAVQWAVRHDLRVAVQASGHGAGAPIGADHLLINTSDMNTVHVDAAARIAHVGAGTTWTGVNAVAEPHGLLGLAGTSPTVSVSGYTFGGGVGFLTRPHGMASSTLLAVDYVDGTGRIRRAAEDADDEMDREALWAFRGGGGVGIATALTLELVAPHAVWAGYRVWSIDALEPVVAAWTDAMPNIGEALSTSLSVLHTPPGAPMFPPALRGVPVVHLAFASPRAAEAAEPLLQALRSAPTAVVDDSWGPADAGRLARIHLDPPNPVPALGIGRWLGPNAPAVSADILRTAAEVDSSVVMVELRNLDTMARARDGALTAVPGPYLLHAVGTAGDITARARTEDGLTRVRAAADTADIGRSAGPFADGRAADRNGFGHDDLQRLARISTTVDPDRCLAPTRTLAAFHTTTAAHLERAVKMAKGDDQLAQ